MEAGERCFGDVCACDCVCVCGWVASAVLCSWAAGVIGAVAAVADGADTATVRVETISCGIEEKGEEISYYGDEEAQ